MNAYILKLGNELYTYGVETHDLTNRRDNIVKKFLNENEDINDVYEDHCDIHYIYMAKIKKSRKIDYNQEFINTINDINETQRVENIKTFDNYFKCSDSMI